MREKILPELDDDFASEASEFDTLDELRADIGEKVGDALEQRAEQDFRIAAVDAAVDAAKVEIPDDLVTARATERGSGWNASSPSAAWTPTPSCRCRAKPARS